MQNSVETIPDRRRPTEWRPRRGRARCRAERGLRASRAEMTARRAWSCGTECGSGVFRAKRKRERVSAKPPGGASEPAVDTCCLRPVWNTGCPCGSVRCRPCRSKGARHAQSHQHNSATVRGKGAVDTTVKPMKSFSETSMFMALASLGCFRPGRNRMRCDEKAPPAGWREGRESGGAAPGTT